MTTLAMSANSPRPATIPKSQPASPNMTFCRCSENTIHLSGSSLSVLARVSISWASIFALLRCYSLFVRQWLSHIFPHLHKLRYNERRSEHYYFLGDAMDRQIQ